jgi:histidinol dehydrogenase
MLDRTAVSEISVRSAAAAILERVRLGGDDELRAMSREFDGVELASLEVPTAARRRALDGLDRPLRTALERAAANIATVHQAFRPAANEVETEPGIVVGRRPDPLDVVGIYAPGGRGAYPSSVLMGAIPARVAGVETIVLCSPPGRNGLPSAVVLAAAEIAGAHRVFAIGGAGAVAAMAFGTQTVPRVRRIVGPGNAWVAAAKLQVQASGAVAIDSPAGPSELLVIADSTANPAVIARELLAQAEHDPHTSVIAITDDQRLGRAIAQAIEDALPSYGRHGIITSALRGGGALIWTETLHDAADFAATYAPEHVMLVGKRAESLLGTIRNAGTVFIGETSSVAFGDYMTGANHVLPTGGTARSYSGLSTSDFVRWTTYQRVTREAASSLADDVGALAESEQLVGHARAARAWGCV